MVENQKTINLVSMTWHGLGGVCRQGYNSADRTKFSVQTTHTFFNRCVSQLSDTNIKNLHGHDTLINYEPLDESIKTICWPLLFTKQNDTLHQQTLLENRPVHHLHRAVQDDFREFQNDFNDSNHELPIKNVIVCFANARLPWPALWHN